jgi:hypothetical protein
MNTLRRAFEARVARIVPSPDALSTIRARIHRRHRLKRRITMSFASVSSAAVVTVTAVLVGVSSCSPPPSSTPPPPGASVSGNVPTSGAPAPGQAGSVPVYYLGTADDRLVLYREYRDVTLVDGLAGRITAALEMMMRFIPDDPDYSDAWPPDTVVRGLEIQNGIATVALSGITNGDVYFDYRIASLTVQELVWTVTAVAADAGTPVSGVRLLIDGSVRAQLWGVAVNDVLQRAASTDTQAPVYLISPQEGETVGHHFRVHIDGSVFEAAAVLRVRNATGAVVDERSVLLSAGAPARGDAFVDVDLPPGRYTLEAFYRSSIDGSIKGMDDHEITVS